MARQFELIFTKRKVRGVATLLEEEAPLTCEAFWNALPLEGDAYHARWAGREVYTLVGPFETDPGVENATILPVPGDLLYFELNPASIDIPPERRTGGRLIDIALFYGRNSFLLGPEGYSPGNLFATITENLAGLAEACESIWREGFAGERMVLRRVESSGTGCNR